MPITFEELASREIDTLYQGAVFLEAGDEGAAEDLVLTTLARAFHIYRRSSPDDDSGRWLEGRLALEFRGRAVPGPADASDALPEPVYAVGVEVRGLPEASAEALYRGAARVPAAARVALWLVLFRRWSYDDASSLLGLDRAELKDLLRYRHTLVAVLLRRNGAPGDAAQASN